MSRQKGNRAELEVAKTMEVWWRKVEPNCIFKRTPLSGGWADASAREAFRTAGDLITSSLSFPFSVEVKRREAWTWERFIQGKKSPVWGWWKQAQVQAVEMTCEPMLWIRQSRKPWTVLISEGYFRAIRSKHPSCGLLADRWEDGIAADFGELLPVRFPADFLFKVDPAVFLVPGF